MTSAATFVALWSFRVLVLAALVVMFAALATAPSLFGASFGALVLGALSGFAVWWMVFFGSPEWFNGGFE